MCAMISGIVTVQELLEKKSVKIGYLRNHKAKRKEEWEFPAERVYVIPKYQREIRWTEKNIRILVDDMVAGSKFLGNVIVSTVDQDEYDIIDGQQRITAIMMVIKAINKRKEKKYELCNLENKSFPDLLIAIDNDFYCNNDTLKKACEKDDILFQYDSYDNLWKYSKNVIGELSESDFYKVEKNLLQSRINLLIEVNDGGIDEQRLCVDYFIDINNKSVKLDCIDILKAYAFKEDFETVTENWATIHSQAKEMSSYFTYPIKMLFLHYILCTVNRNLNYKVKGLNDEYRLTKKTVIGNEEYAAGTDIELLINDKRYYSNMLEKLVEFQKFISVIPEDKSSYSKDFEKYITPKDGGAGDEMKQNIFEIVGGIARCSDVVPKMLILKYYIDVISNPEATYNDYKLIYSISILAAFFSSGKADLKNRKEFSNLVSSKNWKSSIEKKAFARMQKGISIISFDREVKYNGTYTESSGQYLARRIHAILFSHKAGDKKIKFQNGEYHLFNWQRDVNDEHFLINQSYKIEIPGEKNTEFYLYPERLKNRVSYLANYMIIDAKLNKKLGNKTVTEKLILVDKELKNGKKVFADRLSLVIYEEAKKVFGLSSCPTEAQLKVCKTLEEKKQLLSDYYEKDFEKDYSNYIMGLKKRFETISDWTGVV